MLFYMPVSAAFPFAGVLCAEWFSIMAPHRQVYTFLAGRPLNQIIAGLTILGWLLSKERKRLTPDLLPYVMMIWFLWMTVTTAVAPMPPVAWFYWNLTWRVLIPVFLCFALLTTKARIHAMVWVLVISVGYYGVKGGGYVILHAGSGTVFGPPGTMIFDNNALALAVVLELPLVYYLWRNSQDKLIRFALLCAIGLQILEVIGSHSRGGMIALTVELGILWLRSDRKFVYGLIGAIMVGGALSMMPDQFWQRLNTLNNVSADQSFRGRLNAWHVAIMCAKDFFPFGAGFYTPQQHAIFNHYLPDVDAHAAHSIYFQMLGEHGYIGLAIYLVMLVLPLWNATLVLRRTRRDPGLAWAHDLADVIRISLIAFYVGGSALSVCYWDGYLIVMALSSCLRELTRPVSGAAWLPVVASVQKGARPAAPALARNGSVTD
jgi:probable O-glycosylation ligase (exosortase A-associated)